MTVGVRKPAVFLDRDGVLTEERSYVTCLEELKIFPFAQMCVEQIHKKGYYAIVVTNQSGIARGLFTESQLEEMNRFLIETTGVDAVYYCPHHPQGKIERYGIECQCRKPKTGMFEKACRDFAIDMGMSFMVGDRAGDVIAGENAGLQTVLAESGYGLARLEAEVAPDHIIQDLRELTEILVG